MRKGINSDSICDIPKKLQNLDSGSIFHTWTLNSDAMVHIIRGVMNMGQTYSVFTELATIAKFWHDVNVGKKSSQYTAAVSHTNRATSR